MKKILLFVATISILSLSSCRVTKSLVMMSAKQSSELTEENFLNKKAYNVAFLKLNENQLEKAKLIWKEEKTGLNMPLLKNENIAPIIYKSEIEFRKILNTDQNKIYPAMYTNDYERTIPMFLNNKELAEIKRIYLDK